MFISKDALDSVITCEVQTNMLGINTDHVPILMTLDLSLTCVQTTMPKNFHDVDWEEFNKELEAKLDQLPYLSRICTQAELDEACNKLTSTIQDVIQDKVPTTELGVKSKKWWTKELIKLRQEVNRKGRKASRYKDWPNHHSHTERQEANKTFQKTMEKMKRQHWQDWLKKANDPDIWTAHKYISAPAGDGGKCRIPVLKLIRNGQETTATSNNEKSTMLARMFFPPKPPPDDPLHFVYPSPACKYDPINKAQIRRHLAKLKPYKAPGPDSIPNIVLTKSADILIDRLYYIYSAALDKNLYYAPWKLSTTVILRKPGKPRYNTPKVYRPIALLNTMCRVLTAIVAELMTFYTEKYNLLPLHHFRGRPGWTTTDALHVLVHKLKMCGENDR